MSQRISYFPTTIWLQTLDCYGNDDGDPKQTTNNDLLHAQVGDRIKNPRYLSDDVDAFLSGYWVVQEREFSEHKETPPYPVPRDFTLYIRLL